MLAVYHFVQRAYHPLTGGGKWTAEEDNQLRSLVLEQGQQWEKISERVGRAPSDCRDRWRNHGQYRETKVRGSWTAEEDAELTKIVADVNNDKGKTGMDQQDIFWGEVARRMQGRRTRQQCRIRWRVAYADRAVVLTRLAGLTVSNSVWRTVVCSHAGGPARDISSFLRASRNARLGRV